MGHMGETHDPWPFLLFILCILGHGSHGSRVTKDEPFPSLVTTCAVMLHGHGRINDKHGMTQ